MLRLPAGARCRSRIPDGNIRRPQARHRQLALGRRAVLSAYRQVAFQRAPPRSRCSSVKPLLALSRYSGRATSPNILTLRIQPDEGLSISFSAKRPGSEIEIDGVDMDFAYRDYFAPARSGRLRNAHLRLPDRRRQSVPARRYGRGSLARGAKACSIPGHADPVVDFPNYAAGSAGPDAADRLLGRDGRAWLPINSGHQHPKHSASAGNGLMTTAACRTAEC